MNPFAIHSYNGPKTFCDRATELSALLEAFDHGRYVMLYAMRRLGKTGLIHHFHHHLRKRKKVLTIYCDIQNTQSDEAFVAKLITASVTAVEKTKKGITTRIGSFFSSLRPSVTFDPITQLPSIELQIQNPQQVQRTLDILIQMLGELNKSVQISIDEFQQISHYPNGSSIDATLRGYMHNIPNVQFLFSGSQRHLLLDLFSNAKRPFFNSADQIQLKSLDPQVYGSFIQKLFSQHEQKLDLANVQSILEWTRGHTFYTQYFCNRLFAKNHSITSAKEIELVKQEILFSFEPNYLQLRSALSKNQWKMLRAVASEKQVSSVNDRNFLSKYNMAQSSASQALKTLLEKELLYEEMHRNGNSICVYDPYLANWIREVL